MHDLIFTIFFTNIKIISFIISSPFPVILFCFERKSRRFTWHDWSTPTIDVLEKNYLKKKDLNTGLRKGFKARYVGDINSFYRSTRDRAFQYIEIDILSVLSQPNIK